MLAPQNAQFTVLDSIESTQTAWYDEIDAAIKRSDILPGFYEYTTATSYGNVGEIHENESTYVDLAPRRFQVISLDNSYISIEQTVSIRVNKALNTNKLCKYWYIGYKYAPEIIGQYRIHTNTDLLQTVNHANYEWFMIQNSVSDDVKDKDECYATIDKIRRMDPNVPGTYVDLSSYGTPNTAFSVKINVKIPVSSFLLFYNLKWFAEWMGKICIEIYPSYKNLVVCPVVDLSANVCSYKNAGSDENAAAHTLEQAIVNLPTYFHAGFHNINDEFVGILKDTNTVWSTANNSDSLKFLASDQVSDKIQIRTAVYVLQTDVYEGIAQRYLTKPLVFPIQTIESKDFTTSIGTYTSNPNINSAMTVALKHCDAAFTVFKKDINTTTCFENPDISELTFNIDGKYYPREYINTLDDVRSRNLTLDALNCNRSLTTQIPKDLHTSIQPYTNYNIVANNGAVTTGKKYTLGDRSNYLLGIPFADSDDFMGGISTANATIQIQMLGKRNNNYNVGVSFGQATMIITQDCLLKIWAFKSSTRKQIEITHETIEQVALTV